MQGQVDLAGITKEQYLSDAAADVKLRQLIAVHAGTVCGAGCSPCHAGDMTTLGFESLTTTLNGVRVKFALQTASGTLEAQAQQALQAYMQTTAFKTDVINQGGALSSVSQANLAHIEASVVLRPDVKPESGGDDGGGVNGVAVALSVICGLLLCVLIAGGIYFMHYRNKDSLSSQMSAIQHSDELQLEDQDSTSLHIPTQAHGGSFGASSFAAVPVEDTGVPMHDMSDSVPPKYEEDDNEEDSLTKSVA